jgi:3-hydroxyacyl-CoA dehydrogenase
MTAVNSVTDLSRAGEIAVVTIDSPPVNAFSADVRNGLRDGVAKAAADPLCLASAINWMKLSTGSIFWRSRL